MCVFLNRTKRLDSMKKFNTIEEVVPELIQLSEIVN